MSGPGRPWACKGPDSDVEIAVRCSGRPHDTAVFTCCIGCSLANGADVRADMAIRLFEHLREHVDAGHRVPSDGMLSGLKDAARRQGEMEREAFGDITDAILTAADAGGIRALGYDIDSEIPDNAFAVGSVIEWSGAGCHLTCDVEFVYAGPVELDVHHGQYMPTRRRKRVRVQPRKI